MAHKLSVGDVVRASSGGGEMVVVATTPRLHTDGPQSSVHCRHKATAADAGVFHPSDLVVVGAVIPGLCHCPEDPNRPGARTERRQ